MGAKRSRAPRRPSYEEGQFRDASIPEKQDASFRLRDLKRLIGRAVTPKKKRKDS